MCMICVDFELGKLSREEAYHNWGEMDMNDPHSQEVLDLLNDSLYDDELKGGQDYKEKSTAVETTDEDWNDFWMNDHLDWLDYATD